MPPPPDPTTRPPTVARRDTPDGENTPGGGAPSDGVPATVGRFEVRRVLGRGGFGTVYLGFDPGLRRKVAIKVPNAEVLTPTFRERFLREARATATVHHPNVCPVYEVGEVGDRPFLVFKYIPGPTLAHWLTKRDRLAPWQAVRLLAGIAAGVQAAHAVGVIHRDLKPANVLLDQLSGRPVVTDFGLARMADPGDALRTAAGLVMGTPAYMAPEQASGDRDRIGPPTDVYALGVMLYELLAGRLPFDGTLAAILRAKLTADPPSLPAAADVSAALDAVCLRALARNPDHRYQTVSEFAAALRAARPPAQSAESRTGLPAGVPSQHAVTLAYAPVTGPPAVPPARKWPRWQRTWGLAVGVFVLLVALGFAIQTYWR